MQVLYARNQKRVIPHTRPAMEKMQVKLKLDSRTEFGAVVKVEEDGSARRNKKMDEAWGNDKMPMNKIGQEWLFWTD